MSYDFFALLLQIYTVLNTIKIKYDSLIKLCSDSLPKLKTVNEFKTNKIILKFINLKKWDRS